MNKRYLGAIAVFAAVLCLSVPVLADSDNFDLIRATISGSKKSESATAINYNGTLYIPIDSVSAVTNNSVTFDSSTSTVYISSPQQTAVAQKPSLSSEGTTVQTNTLFEFDYLELRLGTDKQWAKVENNYSDVDGSEVFKLPIRIHNISNKSHRLSRSHVKVYGPQGRELKDVNTYFNDSFSKSGSIKSGSAIDSSIYAIYDGPGVYTFEFDNRYVKKEVKVNITK